MNWLRQTLHRLRALARKQDLDARMEEEMRAHIELQTRENLEAGMPPEAARRTAWRQFGWVESIKETCRAERGLPWLESWLQDMRYGLRTLWKSRGFTSVVTITLALGIGAGTAVYSVVHAVILNPVPGPDPDRLLQIGERGRGNKGEFWFSGVTTRAIEILQEKNDLFAAVVWHASLHLERQTADFYESLGTYAVSPNFFAAWGIQPLLGRTFGKDEAVRLNDQRLPETDTVLVLSYLLWQSQFGGDPAVLGRTIEAHGRQFTIIGVMPPHFQFPGGAYPISWSPAQNPPPGEDLGNNRLIVRLRTGVTLPQTQALLEVVAQQLVREQPDVYNTAWRTGKTGFALLARPLRDEFTATAYGAANLQRTLWGLLAAIGCVLLIVCVNVSSLMLARTENRHQELAIRAAVGAGRLRVMRQLLTESLLLTLLGGFAGIAITVWGMQVLAALIPESIPRVRPIRIDGLVLAVSFILCLGTALAMGLAPAWHASRTSVGAALKQAGACVTTSAGWRRYRGALVVSEVALSLILLAGAGLMVTSVVRLLRADPGFNADNLLLVHPGLLRGDRYAWSERSAEIVSALHEQLREQFAAVPGVRAVGIGKIEVFRLGFIIDGREQPVGLLGAGTGVGEGDLFRAMGIPLLAGRYFAKADLGKEAGTVIINQTMARHCWPGQNALHKTFRQRNGPTLRVIGIVADARFGLRAHHLDPVEPTFFRPYHESAAGGGFGPFFVVRTEADPRPLIPVMLERIRSVENSMTTPWFQVARQTLYDSTEAPRLYMLYLVVFASVGLLLTALGIYGVLAYSVSRRTREIGIRLAIGAQWHHVVSMVLREGTRLIAAGIVIGLLGTFWLTRFLQSQLFEVSPTDPGVLLSVVFILIAVALLACALPALRATRTNPVSALKSE